jgi:hypothetical protein
MPSKKCPHNRQPSICKECGGVGICEHNRRRTCCKDGGGSLFCEHNRIHSTCRDCRGSEICEHNKRRSTCRNCGGSQICEHNKRAENCLICKPHLVYKTYKRRAARDQRSFLITLQQFLSIVSQPCDFCGTNGPNGVDRWDNSIGYEFENCRPCCSPCNYFKRSEDGPTFVERCRLIADNTRAVENAGDQECTQRILGEQHDHH